MAYQPEKITQKSARNASVSTVVGISLVLFMLGTLGLLLLNAKKLADQIKENVQLQVYVKDSVAVEDLAGFEQFLNDLPEVKATRFVSSEEAAKTLENELGEDFVSFLGYNPLSASYDIFLKAEFSSAANMTKLERVLRERPLVADVVYSPNLLQQINANINRIALIILGFSVLLLLISIALINNTIRLSIFSKRYLIKTMQLVGATPSFIRRPFLWQGVLQGFYAALLALLLIVALIFGVQHELPNFFIFQDALLYAQLFGAIVLTGIFIAWISTFLAVRKYIRIKSDDLL